MGGREPVGDISQRCPLAPVSRPKRKMYSNNLATEFLALTGAKILDNESVNVFTKTVDYLNTPSIMGA